MGRRRDSGHKLSRSIVQIQLLCALACSWISTHILSTLDTHSPRRRLCLVFMIAMLTQNRSACEWRSGPATCGLFTTVHVLSWFLIVTCKFPPPSLLRLVQRAFSVRGGICYLQQGCNNPRNRHGTSPNAPSSGLASGQRRRGRSEARGHKDIGSSQFQQDMLFVFIIFLYQVYIPDARGREESGSFS